MIDPAGAKRATHLLAHYLRRDWLRCLILVLLGAAVRAPALQGQPIWDDHYLVRGNPFIKSPVLMLEVFRHYLFLDSYSAHYRPMQNISYMLDYFFWNTNEFGYHLTNVLLHVLGGVLLYFLLRQLLPSLVASRRCMPTVPELPWAGQIAFLAALVWCVHPVHSAAVDYISGRADSLAFAFSAGAWLTFLVARRRTTARLRVCFYAGAAVLGFAAILSREIAIIWLLLFVGHLFYVEKGRPIRLRVATSLGCIAIVASYLVLHSLPGARPLTGNATEFSAPVRLTLMLRALGDYGRLMLAPFNLHMERTVLYPGEYAGNVRWRADAAIEYLSLLGVLVLALLVFGCVKSGRGRALRIFGAIWFVAAYLPVSNIIQLNATVAEHWLYLPSVGFILFVIGCAIELPRSCRRVVTALTLLALFALSVRSVIRSSDWLDEETFYQRAFDAGSRSARIAVNLGDVYTARKEYAKAERLFRSVLDQNPEYPIAQTALATVLYRQGKLQAGQDIYAEIEKKALEARKEYARTWLGAYNLAIVLHNAHQAEEAINVLEKTRNNYPDVWEVAGLESELVRQTQSATAARQIVEQFASRNWWHYGAALALGKLYAQEGNINAAEANLRRASWLDVHDAEALRTLVMIRVRENRLADAAETQRRAIARQPDEPRQYLLLSDILERMGRNEEARAALARADQLRASVQHGVAAN